MIFLSARSLSLFTEYGRLEDRFNRDYSAPVLEIARLEYAAQVAAGSAPDAALLTINQALTALVKRYPVQLDQPPAE